ncbi:response regulator [Paenibacillus lignilyticus]|uniref:Response regulator n=1 Tax=Paenibacillus lignilyticus TaxID=1172615 RepID=A0ABS5CGU5_9BACL|nr:response regulator [Paenibacillus lignilyticus]
MKDTCCNQKDKETKILILSARAAIEERVKGLDLGANDYLTKPFDF